MSADPLGRRLRQPADQDTIPRLKPPPEVKTAFPHPREVGEPSLQRQPAARKKKPGTAEVERAVPISGTARTHKGSGPKVGTLPRPCRGQLNAEALPKRQGGGGREEGGEEGEEGRVKGSVERREGRRVGLSLIHI